jgi:NAD(P)-dependent dehydrogenase (short-subunit alcohol dehydrogenase family)
MRVVITGTSRGIGLELVRQLATRGDEVHAAARDPSRSAALQSLRSERVVVHTCDVTDDASVAAFAAAVSGPVDVVVNNAGVFGQRSFEELDLEDCKRVFDVDALGPLRISRAFLPHLRLGHGKRLVHVSSGMGSIADNGSGGAYAYRMAKAALNMASRSLAVDLRPEGILSVVINPGWVKTDMGGDGAPTSVEESVAGIVARIDTLGPEDSGEFLDFRGGRWPF